MKYKIDEIVVMGNQAGKTFRHIVSGGEFTYSQIVQAVANGMTCEWVLEHMRPIGQPEYIMRDLYDRAVQELWEKDVMLKTDMGQLLYG